ncbi:MAG TPA: hypothetical protein VG710_04300 [Opitutus sp.]|nr:hypothetical protein [Opitutus sp.]
MFNLTKGTAASSAPPSPATAATASKTAPSIPPTAPRLSPNWLARQGRLPLAFMALGLGWLAFGTTALVVRPELLTLPHAAPAVVALTHAWVLGFFVTVAVGAIYQLAPVALGTTLWREHWAWWHFGLHAAAVPGMVYAFARWDLTLLAHFGSALALGILLFAINTWQTVRRSGQRDAVAWSLALAAGWLLATVLAGLLLAANRQWPFIPLDPIALLRAHAHLGLVGFFLTLLQGVTFRLVPMFTLGEVNDWRPVRRGLWLSQAGLAGLVPALALHAGSATELFGGLVFAGMIESGRALRRSLSTRKKRRLDPGIAAFVRGFAALLAAGVVGLVLAWPAAAWGSAPGGFSAMVYAVALFAGGLLPSISGMMYKVVPFLTWMRVYGPKVGREATPAAGALANARLETWAFAFQTLAILPLAAGVWRLSPPLLRVGTWLLAAGVALFLTDMAGVLKHLRWPARAKSRPVVQSPAPVSARTESPRSSESIA